MIGGGAAAGEVGVCYGLKADGGGPLQTVRHPKHPALPNLMFSMLSPAPAFPSCWAF